ncbi:MAG: hypothetical protein HFJ26_01925 [Clostridia bacterium]|nr:hypothetical protein [Clostridia bacterium]
MRRINKKLTTSILVILVFLSLFMPKSNANFFTDNNKKDKSEIEKTIDSDDGGIFEKIIAKMIRRTSRSSF